MRNYVTILLMLLSFLTASAQFSSFSDQFGSFFQGKKTRTIKLTGTLNETIEMTVGNSGRKEIISHLPYLFQVSKKDLPLNLSFRADRGSYPDIYIPERPYDTSVGHVYLLKPNETNYMAGGYVPQPQPQAQSEPQSTIVGIDTSYGVNAAPVTGKKAENTYALIIANEEYEMATNVEMATNDGLAVQSYFTKTLGLTDKQIIYCPNATYGKMSKALRDVKNIAEAYNGKINLIVYYAGHGIPDNDTKDAYLMPVDADGTDVGVCFSLKKLYETIDAMHLNQAVVLLDACFSGASPDGGMIVAARGVAIKPKEEKPVGTTIVLSAASDSETAFPYKSEKHGLFTYCFLKALQDKKGKINLGELAKQIQTNVGVISVRENGKKQTPTVNVPTNLAGSWENMRLTGE